MDIKNSAITAKMVIHSLLALLENENVDISSVKFKIGSDGNGYESPEFELEKLVSLAIDGLVGIEEANAVPEWNSVGDKEPPLGTMVLICWSDAPDVEPEKDYMDHDVDHGVNYWANYNDGDEPSHWMLLPEPVAQEQSHD
jgi:hypothetical protein